MAKNYLDLPGVSRLLENLRNTFATLVHKHTLSDIEDYTVDSELSTTSANPVQNKVVNDGLSITLDTAKGYTDTKVASMVFIGTYAEYQTAYANGQIPVNSFVILTDEESGGGSSGGNESTDSTTAMLGYAVLGQMVLG
jgi:hypothetical protein